MAATADDYRISPEYWTNSVIEYSHKAKGVTNMYSIRYVHGHVQVYDVRGNFLFSADNEREAREELVSYEESAA